MWLLILVSLLWAFSFGLTKGRLAGLDSAFVSAARLTLALLVFLPFLRWRGLAGRTALSLVAIGAVQFGLMYLALNESYRHLQAHEVVLFTITTPIFVTLFAGALDRAWSWRPLLAAVLAVAGTAMVAMPATSIRSTLTGIALMQGSNAAFAIGQVLYRRLRQRQPALHDRNIFALLYAGACIVAIVAMFFRIDVRTVTLTPTQTWTLLYLGVLASGAGFFLWNVGATRVNAATLGVMNNAKVPLGVAVSLLVFGEHANLPALLGSFVLLAMAVWVAEK
jgi:drug/metabolite transporter (DMT)-like permease